MKEIILTTLNARYTHSAIGLRYLYANMNELQDKTTIMEFVIGENIQTLSEKILDQNPKIVGIGIYIWNATEVSLLVNTIKKVSPQTIVVLGGPEVSHMPIRVNFDMADYILQGEADVAFYDLCKNIYNNILPDQKIIKCKTVDTKKINLPYKYYTDDDIAHRYIYVEASRGCPFECEFCLSAIDEKVRNFDIDLLLSEFELLWQRGVKHFKFIDRTFNLNIKIANTLIDFFLNKESSIVHFEVIPDNFPQRLKEKIANFPPTALQLEIGIQTLNPMIANNIKRNLNITKIKENIEYLEKYTNAHLHLDLIVGLPGESLESFANNLNELCAISDSEIQVGILKKLSGTTLDRHDKIYGMVYSDTPPYDLLANNQISFKMMQKMKRFARFWDLYYNSGNFKQTIKYLWKDESVFKSFFDFSEWIYKRSASTWQISLQRLSEYLFEYLTDIKGYDKQTIATVVQDDLIVLDKRNQPAFLKPYVDPEFIKIKIHGDKLNKRQQKHAIKTKETE